MDESAKLVNLSSLKDEDLVVQAREGNKGAFSELVVRYQDRVITIVSQRIRDRESAYDIAQEVFIKAYKGLKGFKAESGFYTWLYRIAVNTTYSHRRKAARRGSPLSLDRAYGGGEDDGKHEVADEGTDPGQEAIRQEQIDAVRAAVAELEDDFNEVIVLRDLQGLSYEEIADILQCPVGSIKSRLHRARKKLLAKLKNRVT